ncbi:MAG: hypothetical protein AABX47_10665 [Nanoarchaeota archaeon]
MATKNYLRIHRAWGPVRKSMALTTTRLNDTLDDLVAKGTIAQDADYDDKRACLNCRSGESMFKWCAEADDIWGRDEKKRSLNTINESIAKSCAPFIQALHKFHDQVSAHPFYEIRADFVKEAYESTIKWSGIISSYLLVCGEYARIIERPSSLDIDQVLRIYPYSRIFCPDTEITNSLRGKFYLEFHPGGVGWWQYDLSRALGHPVDDHMFVEYSFNRMADGFWPYLIKESGRFLGEYHYSEGEERVVLWYWCDDLNGGLENFNRSAKDADFFKREGITHGEVYHLRDGSNVSKERFLSEVKGRIRLQKERSVNQLNSRVKALATVKSLA